MILYFADRGFEVKGLASTNLDSDFVIVSDTKTESIEKHISTFDAEIAFTDANRKKLEELTNAGNYILRHVDEANTEDTVKKAIEASYAQISSTDVFTIIESEIDIQGKTITIYAEDLGLDLLNDLAYSYNPGGYKDIQHYVEHFTSKAGFTVGVNELPEPNKYLTWEDTTTVTERLNSIASEFECELSYTFNLRGMRISEKLVNIYKKRGTDTHEILSIGKNLNNIKVKRAVTNLATALIPTGADDLTLTGYTYDDDDFYVSDGVLYSRDALNAWSRYKTDTGHIFRTYSSAATQQVDLCNDAIKELKKLREPEINYSVDIAYLPANVSIGDTVYVVDDFGELYVSGRILELKTSASTNRKTATIGDYKIKTSGISDIVNSLAADFAVIAANRVLYTWVIYADSNSGENASITKGDRLFVGILANQVKELTSDEQLTSEVLKKVTWQFIMSEEAASTAIITLTPVNGVVYKKINISTTINAVITLGTKVVQTKQQLQSLFGDMAHLKWYINNSEIQNEDNFVLAVNDTTGVSKINIGAKLVAYE